MAQDQVSVTLTHGAWTQLTNADATTLTLQTLSGEAFVRFTTDGTTPTETAGQRWPEGSGALMTAIASLTALSGAVRVWAKPVSSVKTVMYIDHA